MFTLERVVIPDGWYVIAWDLRIKNPDGSPDHGVYGPIPEDRLQEWADNEGEWFEAVGEDWDTYDSADLLEALKEINVFDGIEEAIWVNDPWSSEEGFKESRLYHWRES